MQKKIVLLDFKNGVQIGSKSFKHGFIEIIKIKNIEYYTFKAEGYMQVLFEKDYKSLLQYKSNEKAYEEAKKGRGRPKKEDSKPEPKDPKEVKNPKDPKDTKTK